MEWLAEVGRSEENVPESDISMVNVIFSELAVAFDDFHPYVEHFSLVPAIGLGCFPILNQIEQAVLKIPKDHHQGV